MADTPPIDYWENRNARIANRVRGSQQLVIRVRSRIMLRSYAKVVNSIAHLNDEEIRRVMKAANITCGEAP